MKLLRSLVLYTSLAACAIPALAADIADLEALREGSLKKLVFASEPVEVSQEVFTDPEGGEHTLADWQGKHVLVNFWATWCAPCRKEMPELDALQEQFGGDDFEVVTIATGRNMVPALKRFFEETDITHLPILLDPKQKLARDMAVLGLPITVIMNPEGQEIARLRGDAEWHSESAQAIIAALIAAD